MTVDLAFHLSAVTPGADPGELAPLLDALAGIGYRRAVLPPLDPAATDAVALAEVFRDAGVAPVTMCGQAPGADVSSADAAERAAGRAMLLAAVDLAVALGADQLNGVPYGLFGHPTAPVAAEAFARSAREVGAVADEAAARGVQLTFEVLNRYEVSGINTAEQAVAYAEASGSAALGIHLDAFHMAIEEPDAAAAVRTALPRLRYLELGQSGRGSLARGAVDVAGLVRAARDAGYDGRYGVEAFSRPLMHPAASDMLAIWRAPYDDGLRIAAEAYDLITDALEEG